MKTRTFWLTLITILLISFALRVTALDAVPPGLTHDEASNGHDAAALLRGELRLYFPVGYGHEPLYDYSVAALMALLGQSIFALRLTTVGWSLLLWSATVALARRWWGRRAALFTAAALTAGFWPLMMARVGLRAPTLPALLALTVLLYEHARASRSSRLFALAGFTLGASLYTYMASRGMPLMFVALLPTLAWLARDEFRRTWRGIVLLLIVAALTAAPLFLYLHAHPGMEQRLGQLGGALTALRHGDWRPLWQNVRASLPMLFWQADPHWLYNIAGRPALEPLLALGFGVGLIALLVRREHQPHTLLLMLWLGAGLAPAFLAPVDFNTLHAIAALPAVFLVSGRGLAQLGGRKAGAILLSAALALTGALTARDYFSTWGGEIAVRTLYHQHLVALGRTLDRAPDTTPVIITSLTPGEFHDPYVLEVTMRRSDVPIRWVNGQGALFFPAGAARLYTERQSAPAPQFAPALRGATKLPDQPTFLPEDPITTVLGLAWDAAAGWRTLHAPMADTVAISGGDLPPAQTTTTRTCPLSFGGIVALQAYRLTLTPAAVTLLSAWQVQAPAPQELVLFTHLLDWDGQLLRQVDRLDAPSWQWQPGDRWMQVHTLPLPPDLPPGDYALAVGFYRRADVQRLTVDAPPAPVTRILIPFHVR